MAWVVFVQVVSRSINGEQQACLVLFLFYVVLPFQRYSTLFVILECFRPQKIYLFFLCNISSLCAISYVPMVAIYVYQLNIWLLFESMWLNSMFISHEGVVCLYLHSKLHPRGKYRRWGLSSLLGRAVHKSTLTWNRTSLQVRISLRNLAYGLLKKDHKDYGVFVKRKLKKS